MENFQETKTSQYQRIKDEERTLNPELKKVLKLFEDYGYVTHKGSNSFVLANILVDYSQRLLEEKAANLAYLNYWETQDISVLSRLAYERYRIYNTRKTPNLYENSKSSYGLLRTYHNDQEVLADCEEYTISLGNPLKISAPIKLKKTYDSLYAKSLLVDENDNQVGLESFMDDEGGFIEMDYIIIPDLDNEATFIPSKTLIDNLKQSKSKNIKLKIFLEKSSAPPASLKKIKEGYDIDCDYIRFVTTELFAKFKILNRMSVYNFVKFLKLKYKKDFKIEGNVIISPVKEGEEILDFARRNVIPVLGKSWEYETTSKITLEAEEGLYEHFKNHDAIIKSEDLDDYIDYVTKDYYSSKYGFRYKDYLKVPEIKKPKNLKSWCYLEPKVL